MNIKELIGLTLTNIEKIANDALIFEASNGRRFKMYHSQDCCESVEIEDICGDLQDLVGSPIIKAEEVTNQGENPPGVRIPDCQYSFTWTFYHLSTAKGTVTIRWYGGSNGYYSEEVDFDEMPRENQESKGIIFIKMCVGSEPVNESQVVTGIPFFFGDDEKRKKHATKQKRSRKSR